MKTSDQQQGGLTFASALALIFITLKLTGVITWSWWWVTCPMWGGLAIVLGIFLVFALCSAFAMAAAVICTALFAVFDKKGRRK